MAIITTAYTCSQDGVGAAHELAGRALADLDGSPAWALLVVGGHHDGARAVGALRQIIGEVPVYGGACVGAMGEGDFGYTGFEVGLMLFAEAPAAVSIARGVGGGEREAGRRLAQGLREDLGAGASVLLLYDTPRPDGAGLVVGSELLDGYYSQLGDEHDGLVFGAGLIGDTSCSHGFIFTGESAERDAAVGIVLPGSIRTEVRIMHGVRPLGPRHRITHAEGTRIHALDGEPATAVLMRDLGLTPDELDDHPIVFSVLLGRRGTDDDSEHPVIIRLIVDMDIEAGWVQLFESDLGRGDEVEVMLRDPQSIIESVEGCMAELPNQAGDVTAGIYIDCAGRTAPFTGMADDEAALVLGGMPDGVPLLGFYVGREIAPADGRSRPHDWTGVLVTLTDSR